MIPITTTTYGIIVPIDAYEIEIIHNWLEYRAKIYLDKRDTKISKNGFKDLEILGTVSNQRVDFDCSELVNGHGMLNNKYALEALIKSKGIELKQNEKLLILKTV